MSIRPKTLLTTALVVVPLAAAAAVVTSTSSPVAKAVEAEPLRATAKLFDIREKSVGMVAFTQATEGVLVAVDARGLPQGELAMHIHEKGVCNPKEKFTTAGGHFNPEDKKHGLHHKEGAHAGDMPNVVASEQGIVSTQVVNNGVSLMKGVSNSVFDEDGSALVIHARADDHTSQPAGDAGDRIACGVIVETRSK